MPSRFEFFVARRYLRAKRKQAVISIITVISILGVAAGVMALVVALAINNGFRNTLQQSLLGATAHVNIVDKRGYGIENWQQLVAEVSAMPHVIAAAPTLYEPVFLSSPLQPKGALLKGINPNAEKRTSNMLNQLKQGSLSALNRKGGLPGIILGSRLSQDTGLPIDSVVTLLVPQGELSPIGMMPSAHRFRVVGVFESGFYDIDASWAFANLSDVQKILGLGDVVNAVEIKLDDLYLAPQIAATIEKTAGENLGATPWQEQNRQLLNALQMEKAVTVVTISLIVLVAALNILITLVMMVMEKYRDIAILMSMGTRHRQIRNIFVFEGLIIGVIGTVAGLAIGHTICYFADTHRWIRLDETVYALSFVPFEPRLLDSLWIAGLAILVSFLATLYPARSATRIAPAEVLRYE